MEFLLYIVEIKLLFVEIFTFKALYVTACI